MRIINSDTINTEEKNTAALFLFSKKKALFSYTKIKELDSVVTKFSKELEKRPACEFSLEGGADAFRVILADISSVKGQERSEALKILIKRKIDSCRNMGIKKLIIVAAEVPLETVCAAAEAYYTGTYGFKKYLSDPDKKKNPEIIIAVSRADSTLRKMVKEKKAVFSAINRARDIVNETGEVANPEGIEKAVRKMMQGKGLKISIINAPELKKQGYNGLVTVGKGSVCPPRMMIIRYMPGGKNNSRKKLALVGKGISFDTGGICLKPGKEMWEMKCDMAGAAAVAGIMASMDVIKPSFPVVGILALAENMIGSGAVRPGDIFRAKNGKTVMVDNTDAEGRLVLSDALCRAGEEKATHIIDFATLTGACLVALGESISAIMGNDEKLTRAVIDSGKKEGDAVWELPLFPEYREKLKTPYADINNVGGREAGTITAGLFLSEFVPKGAKWAHMDIAGTAFRGRPWKYYAEGATGIPAKTIVRLIKDAVF
ncbi:MAG: leucyl aminopeptidase family protein [Fibrobacterota bacterium]